MPLMILSLVVQLALVVHILKTGRSMSWAFFVLFFPLIGVLAYVIVELWPEFSRGRTAQRMRRKVVGVVNPDRELKQAAQQFAAADTVQNAMDLAEQCLEKGRYAEASQLYVRALRGIHANDPHLLIGLAKAQFGAHEFGAVLETLDRLRKHNPEFDSAEGHMLYARANEGIGNLDEALHEYEALSGYYSGPEALCRLALMLRARGENDRARALFQRVVTDSRIAGKHYRVLYNEWVTLAEREA
jgi:hypothetical protein